jgi:hypothetical protein
MIRLQESGDQIAKPVTIRPRVIVDKGDDLSRGSVNAGIAGAT